LTPKYGYAADQTVSITTDQLYIDDTDVMLFPTMATSGVLMAGEVYSVTVSSSSFKDMTSNYYGGLTSGFTISTKRQTGFVEASTTGEWGAGISYFTGERYGSAGVVDDSQNIYMIGGGNGTKDSPTSSMMNDVWVYTSKRELSCASSFEPLGTCPQTTCTIGADGQSTLGSVAVKKTVWRAPSASGAPCMDGATEVRTLWGSVTTDLQACPCPMCLSAPGGAGVELPTNMVNTSYVSAYTLISAAPSTRDLHCVDGKAANGSFTCVVDTPYIGKYQTPYPECIPAPCTSPPVISGVADLAEMDIAGSTDGMNCSALSSTNSIKSGGLCAVKCKAGYTSSGGGFACFEGVLSEPSCAAQTCDIAGLGVLHGTLDCSSGSSFTDVCEVKCDAGYRLSTSGATTATCGTQTDDPEAKVAWQLSAGTPSTLCEMITCTTPVSSNGAFALVSGEGITSVWALACSNGFMGVASTGLTAMCTSDGTVANAAGGTTVPSCTSAPGCSGTDTAYESVTGATGSDCGKSMSDGDTCTVSCETGKTATGSFECLSGSLSPFSTCFDSSDSSLQVVEVKMLKAKIRATLDLSSTSIAEATPGVSKSLATALAVDSKDVIVNEFVEVNRRLDASSQRRLAGSSYDIGYQVIIPDGVNPLDILAKASDIATPGSAVSAAFTNAMQSESLPVSDLELVSAPRQYTATVVRSPDGDVVTPAPTTATAVDKGGSGVVNPGAADAAEEDDGGGGAGAIIGGVIGGLFGVGIVGFLVYWFVIRKKSQQE